MQTCVRFDMNTISHICSVVNTFSNKFSILFAKAQKTLFIILTKRVLIKYQFDLEYICKTVAGFINQVIIFIIDSEQGPVITILWLPEGPHAVSLSSAFS